jgi:hypothetical protein
VILVQVGLAQSVDGESMVGAEPGEDFPDSVISCLAERTAVFRFFPGPVTAQRRLRWCQRANRSMGDWMWGCGRGPDFRWPTIVLRLPVGGPAPGACRSG